MFDRVLLLSMERRADRMRSFYRLGFPKQLAGLMLPEVFTATDAHLVPAPSWWTQTPGSWGCLMSHLRIIEDCLNRGVESCLIFEDDAVLADDFAERFPQFMQALPDDWQMVYPGGCCRKVPQMPPTVVNDQVVHCKSLTGTWGYGFRGTDFMRQLYSDLWDRLFTDKRHHIDIMLCHLHEHYRVYAPHRWLVIHPPGDSDVRHGGKTAASLNFPDPIDLASAAVA